MKFTFNERFTNHLMSCKVFRSHSPLNSLNSSRIRLHVPKISCPSPVFNLIAYQLQFSCLYPPGCRAQQTYQESHFWRKLILLPLEAKAVQSTSVRGGASHCILELWLLWLCASNHSYCAFMSGGRGQGPLPTGLSSQPKIILCKFFFLPAFLFMAPYFFILKFDFSASQMSLVWTVLITLPYTHSLPWLSFFLVSDLRKKKRHQVVFLCILSLSQNLCFGSLIHFHD